MATMALMTVAGSRSPSQASLHKPPVPIPRKKQARGLAERKKKFLEAKRLFEEENLTLQRQYHQSQGISIYLNYFRVYQYTLLVQGISMYLN